MFFIGIILMALLSQKNNQLMPRPFAAKCLHTNYVHNVIVTDLEIDHLLALDLVHFFVPEKQKHSYSKR